MSWTVLISGFAALALGRIIKWYLTLRWTHYLVDPNGIVFPDICPVCLSPADTAVEENSSRRVTAHYVVARRFEWWSAKIPHCLKCERKQVRDLVIGIALGATCALAVAIANPPPRELGEFVIYAFFAYPFYVVSDNLRKGVAFGSANSKMLNIRIRRREYFDRFVAANSASAVAETPLANNSGVWRH